MAELKEDIELDKAAEKYVKEIMKIQYKNDARKKERLHVGFRVFQDAEYRKDQKEVWQL